MFRERMKVAVSKAERQIVLELQRRGYANHLITQKGHKLHPYHDKVEGTRTDIEYGIPYNLCIYIDCDKWHQKRKAQIRDNRINMALLKRGYHVKRYSYKYPLSKRRRLEIVTDITTTLDKLGYTPT